jgi:hypothetical protein
MSRIVKVIYHRHKLIRVYSLLSCLPYSIPLLADFNLKRSAFRQVQIIQLFTNLSGRNIKKTEGKSCHKSDFALQGTSRKPEIMNL